MNLRRLSTRSPGFDAALDALTRYEAAQDDQVESAARTIIADVRARGDDAVLEYSKRFDRIRATAVADLEVGRPALKAAFDAPGINFHKNPNTSIEGDCLWLCSAHFAKSRR